ncbi:uncharacterized protein LOC100901999 [Galendromus occidentalis]|uniref:Uncharacterized protein LOC100901999 n=1 Tax=Galendromus occidentalis TaxID=34638 RepID=A0AAJ7P9H4_9ACAR|nr:uncharacterized protein LOC100901999 [Galendromus occidentalis]
MGLTSLGTTIAILANFRSLSIGVSTEKHSLRSLVFSARVKLRQVSVPSAFFRSAEIREPKTVIQKTALRGTWHGEDIGHNSPHKTVVDLVVLLQLGTPELKRSATSYHNVSVDVPQQPHCAAPSESRVVPRPGVRRLLCAMMLCSKLSCALQNVRQISSTSSLFMDRDRKAQLRALPTKDEGTQGVRSVDIAPAEENLVDRVTFSTLFNGVPYKDLPIVHVKCSMNNTLCTLTQANGNVIARRSGGTEGYKHTKKGTTVAAQAAATSIAYRAFRVSLKDVRLVVKGLGPGRLASVKSLQQAGLNIVSITDHTPASLCPPRPRKPKRL